MVDTFDCKWNIDYFQWPKITNGVNRFIKKRNIPGHTKMLHPPDKKMGNQVLVTASFTDLGIQEFALCRNQYPLNEGTADAVYLHYIQMTVKPANFLYPDDPYALSKFDDLYRTECEVNRFIDDLNMHIGYRLLPPIINWRATRFDYACQFSSPDYLAYLFLFKKERPKRDSKVYYVTGMEQVPAEVRYWNGHINFHVYDKTVELWEKYGYCDNASYSGNHVLRFENQCKGRCLSSIVHKAGLGQCGIRSLWIPEIAGMKIRNAIKKIIGTEDFYSLSGAQQVLSQHYSERKVRDMVEFMRPGAYPKTKGNRLAALYAERLGLDKTRVKNNFLPYFHRAGVNIRVLPDDWKIDHLVNPVKLLGLDSKK